MKLRTTIVLQIHSKHFKTRSSHLNSINDKSLLQLPIFFFVRIHMILWCTPNVR